MVGVSLVELLGEGLLDFGPYGVVDCPRNFLCSAFLVVLMGVPDFQQKGRLSRCPILSPYSFSKIFAVIFLALFASTMKQKCCYQ